MRGNTASVNKTWNVYRKKVEVPRWHLVINQRRMARDLGYSYKTVRFAFEKLIRLGFIRVVSEPGTMMMIDLTFREKIGKRPQKHGAQTGAQNHTPNTPNKNTRIYITPSEEKEPVATGVFFAKNRITSRVGNLCVTLATLLQQTGYRDRTGKAIVCPRKYGRWAAFQIQQRFRYLPFEEWKEKISEEMEKMQSKIDFLISKLKKQKVDRAKIEQSNTRHEQSIQSARAEPFQRPKNVSMARLERIKAMCGGSRYVRPCGDLRTPDVDTEILNSVLSMFGKNRGHGETPDAGDKEAHGSTFLMSGDRHPMEQAALIKLRRMCVG